MLSMVYSLLCYPLSKFHGTLITLCRFTTSQHRLWHAAVAHPSIPITTPSIYTSNHVSTVFLFVYLTYRPTNAIGSPCASALFSFVPVCTPWPDTMCNARHNTFALTARQVLAFFFFVWTCSYLLAAMNHSARSSSLSCCA